VAQLFRPSPQDGKIMATTCVKLTPKLLRQIKSISDLLFYFVDTSKVMSTVGYPPEALVETLSKPSNAGSTTGTGHQHPQHSQFAEL